MLRLYRLSAATTLRRAFLNQLCRWQSTAGHATHAPIVLRPYQEHCVETCLEALDRGQTRMGVSLPTGAGKTTVFLTLLAKMIPKSPEATRTLVIVNSIELAKQAAAQATRLFPEWTVEIEQGQKHVATALADLTVATYQTLIRGTRLQKFDPTKLKAIIIDEAHHAAAASYLKLLSYFDEDLAYDRLERPPSKIPIIGFSATFSRHDGLALGAVFDTIVYHTHFWDMIKDNWLSPVRFTTVKVNMDLSKVTVSTQSGDFNATTLAHVVNTETINNVVLQAWLDRAATRKSTLIFCVNLAHVRDLTDVFRDSGIDARYIHNQTPPKERVQLLDDFRAARFPVLINCAILTEGADIPNIDCVILARPTKSRNLFSQMMGRGMRLSPGTGKVDCHVLDFVDSANRVHGVVNTPSLFGLVPEEDIKDATPKELEERAKAGTSVSPNIDVPDPKSITYKDYDDPFALMKDTSGAPHIRQLSSYSWVGVGEEKYVLECLGAGFIKVEPYGLSEDAESDVGSPDEVPKFVATFVGANRWGGGKSPFLRPRRIVYAANLTDAVRASDEYARKRVCPGRMSQGLQRGAQWRKEPATPGQISAIAQRWGLNNPDAIVTKADEVAERRARLDKMNKGEAGDIISRLKHGAGGRYQRKQQAQSRAVAKAAKVASREQERQERLEVKVGPLRHATP